jgi:hypothetical protein
LPLLLTLDAQAQVPVEVAPGSASTETVRACIEQHDAAQQARIHERWFEARETLEHCSSERCPLAITADCRTWLDELERAIPTILVIAEWSSPRASRIELRIDGQPRTLAGTPAAVELLPGNHHLVFESPPYPPVEQDVVVTRGEKNHVVRVRFELPVPVRHSPPAAPAVSRPIPPITFWFSGAALVAGATSAALLFSSLHALAVDRQTCAPECHDADSIRTRLNWSTMAGGASLACWGVAAYTWWTRPTVISPSPLLNLDISRGSANLALRGQF